MGCQKRNSTHRESCSSEDMSGSSNQSSASPGSANGKKFVEDHFSTPLAAPDAWDIRKNLLQKKAADLERLRTESRLKARLKTDEELGLDKSVGDRRSMPIIELANSSLADISSTPKARGRGMSLSNTRTPSPRVTRSLTVGAGDIPVQTVRIVENREEPTMGDKQTSSSQPSAAMPRPPSTGLLSRLFSPDAIRKPKPQQSTNSPVNPERIHSESRKETNMLGSTFRRFKLKREEHSARGIAFDILNVSPNCSPPCIQTIQVLTTYCRSSVLKTWAQIYKPKMTHLSYDPDEKEKYTSFSAYEILPQPLHEMLILR
ncbi:hypothetical protein ANCCAN_17636 [Ancylostoma caninum]|uniref:Uncharacterized protein n=1 Tax=Ancylostoma caninum TaxID=29170 RepID=A0A368FWI8_ANCCA|nr:hypothetical protein ANCCAN_17636 [Ancylostoma caninum]